MLVFLVTACLLAPFFLPNSNLPLLPQRYMQFQYRPWCSSFKGIRALTELLIKNFYWRSPHFSAFEIPNYNPQKVHAIPVAITSCFFVFFPPFQPHNLPTFPNFPISPFSHLSQIPNLTTLPPFSNVQPHHPPTFPNFSNSPPFHLQVKALQNNNIRPSLSSLVFKRRFTISELEILFCSLFKIKMSKQHGLFIL